MASSSVELDERYGDRFASTEKPFGDSTFVERDADDVFRTPGAFRDSEHDMGDMKRLGKAQEFKRNFSYLSTLGFISVYMATWEIVLIVLSLGLYSGGFAGLFWAFFGTCIVYAPVVASLAEMESM